MDDFHKPTYTFPDGLYNATQVRLYGLVPPSTLIPASQTVDFIDSGYQIQVSAKKPRALAKNGTTTKGKPSIVSIYTKKKEKEQFVLLMSWSKDGGNSMEAGIIVGYAFEGHCYDLPKPKMMLIPAEGIPVPKDDCGYDKKNKQSNGSNGASSDDRYRVWIVDKLDECVEIDVSQGFVEQLVLEANLPGKRSPSTYRATMALAHRSGRLTE